MARPRRQARRSIRKGRRVSRSAARQSRRTGRRVARTVRRVGRKVARKARRTARKGARRTARKGARLVRRAGRKVGRAKRIITRAATPRPGEEPELEQELCRIIRHLESAIISGTDTQPAARTLGTPQPLSLTCSEPEHGMSGRCLWL
jgi:hypothetical protein